MQPHDNTTPTKTCTKCGKTKPLSEFSKNRSRPDGLQDHCKECNRAWLAANKERVNKKRRERYWADPDTARSNRKQWRDDNIEQERERDRNRRNSQEEKNAKAEYDRRRREELGEQLLEQSREWYLRNKDTPEYKVKQRRYYRENRKRIYERVRRWVRDNPEKAKAQYERRRARELNAPGEFTGKDIKRQYNAQKGRCYYCGCKVGDNYHVDHVIPLSRGGTNNPDNLVIACPSCNCSKQDKLPHEWPEGGRLI